MEWLEELEIRVHEASERLRELQEENRSLRQRIEELEGEESGSHRERIADLELKLARAEEAAGQERAEIRGRVERLTRQLEGLIG
jgi:predicted nuclease with TOPRIM domain